LPHHCISHVKDIDGLSSAALVVAAKGGTFRLTDYEEVIRELDAVPFSATGLTICDLGTNTSSFPEFVARLAGLASRMPVTYIDHHYLTEEDSAKIRKTGVDLRHDVRECASMLTYITYRDALPQSASILALFGAVTDYMDGSENASRMMEVQDRQYVLLESTMLAFALAKNGADYPFAEMLVKELAQMKTPHAIDGVARDAVEQAETVRLLAEEVKARGTRMNGLAYMRTEERSTGNVAKLLLGAFGVAVGVAYKVKPTGRAEFSLRGTSESGIHLGKEIGAIAQRHNGSGGGHEKAAGGSVPVGEVDGLLRDLNARLSGGP
jgi:single-stranded-DNA-specific exonuclease